MMTLLLFFGVFWLGVGAWVTAKVSYWLENKYDWCAPCIHYLSMMLWFLLPFAVAIDLREVWE